jgi:SAM-dependent methyltransferase
MRTGPLRPSLPARYQGSWRAPFFELVEERLRPGIAILDVGAGRTPTISAERRPAGVEYVGLDISAAELAVAGPGAYDETWIADITQHIPELDGRFDLILSWQVLEHVKPLSGAFENLRRYLRPGGIFVGQFSGQLSYFALINRVIPHRLTAMLVDRFTERDADAVFPAYFDGCRDSRLRPMLTRWSRAEVIPRYTGAAYLRFLPPAQWLYLKYEDWAMRSGRRDLATHYIVEARR